jgi:SAM-dependent methyltransferase
MGGPSRDAAYVTLATIPPRQSGRLQATDTLKAYYRDRASTYDAFYDVPEFAEDLTELKAWLRGHAQERSILEVAAGTGYWTEVAAQVARTITAVDCNQEALAVANGRKLGPNVDLQVGDAYALPNFGVIFDVGMANLWWSHVRKERRDEFLSGFAARLKPAATLLMIDQLFSKALCANAWRRDHRGNRFELRSMKDGVTYEVLKNYPGPDEVRKSLAGFCDRITIKRLRFFWALEARICPR